MRHNDPLKTPLAALVRLTVAELAERVRAVKTTSEIEQVRFELERRQVARIPLDSDVDGEGITHD